MTKWTLLNLATLSLLLSGCQSHSVLNQYVHDPVAIHHYELPVPVRSDSVMQTYRQIKHDQILFWSILTNDSTQQGENVIIQIVAAAPQSQPPPQFGFAMPASDGVKAINALGPFQYWRAAAENDETCVITSQYQKRGSNWVSMFSHLCSTQSSSGFSWLEPRTTSKLNWGL